MMEKADQKKNKGLSLLKKAKIAAVSGMLLTAFAGSAPHAQDVSKFNIERPSKNVHALKYVLNPPDDTYTMAWRAMADIFENTTYNLTQPYAEKPYLYVAKTDLNTDGVPDYIAYPLEWNEYDEGVFTLPDTTQRVHVIFTGTLDRIVILGKIYANAIDVGNETVDGYKSLKAYAYEDEADIGHPERFSYYANVKFNKETGHYEMDTKTAPKKDNAPKPEKK